MMWNHLQNYYIKYSFKGTIFKSHKLILNMGEQFTAEDSKKMMPFLQDNYKEFGFSKFDYLPNSLRIMKIDSELVKKLETKNERLYIVFKFVEKSEFNTFANIPSSTIMNSSSYDIVNSLFFTVFYSFFIQKLGIG